MEEIFDITNFFDDARWKNKDNYNLINFFRDGLSNDSKILTHWICYITDRQMNFRRIWDVGGFVFSELVAKIKENKTLDYLNPNNENAFFIKRKKYKDRDKYKDRFRPKNDDKHVFVSNTHVNNNLILLKYGFKEETKPFFISRFYPSDYLSILYTFKILEDYEYCLTKYIMAVADKFCKDDDFIAKLLFSLYLLTYWDIGQPNSKQLSDFENNLKNAEDRSNKVNKRLSDKNTFNDAFKKFKDNSTVYKQKRAWCSLRDFIKSPEFKECFFNSLKEYNSDYEKLFRTNNVLRQLELPGDVWNNNPIFRKCILGNSHYKDSNDLFPKLLRKIFEKENIISGYPEQFDITFDFVPRMCGNNNCSICLYGKALYKNHHLKGKNFNRTCIKDENYYCPVVLNSCNYKMNCLGDKCIILKYLK